MAPRVVNGIRSAPARILHARPRVSVPADNQQDPDRKDAQPDRESHGADSGPTGHQEDDHEEHVADKAQDEVPDACSVRHSGKPKWNIRICRWPRPGQVGRRKSVTSGSFSNPADMYAATP